MALNATAVMVAAREVYAYLKDAGGLIVNIGSFFDRMGVPDNLSCPSSEFFGELGRVDIRDSHQALGMIQAGICDGDQLGTKQRWS